MLIMRRPNGEELFVEHDEGLGRLPATQKERDEVYERIGAEVDAALKSQAGIERGHEQPAPCAARPHPTFRGRRRK